MAQYLFTYTKLYFKLIYLFIFHNKNISLFYGTDINCSDVLILNVR